MRKKSLLLHLVTFVACFVLGIMCLNPVSVSAETNAEALTEKTLVAGNDFNSSTTDIKADLNDYATIVAGGKASEKATGLKKVYFNEMSRGKAGFIKFTEPITVSEYCTISFYVSKNMEPATQLDFYKNEEGVKLSANAAQSAQTENITVGTYNNILANRQMVTLQLKNFADENDKVNGFIVVHTTDERESDYEGFTLNIYNMTCTPVADYSLEVKQGKEDFSIDTANINGALSSPSSIGLSYEKAKKYANGFNEYCAFKLNFTSEIDTYFYKTIVLSVDFVGRNVTLTQYWSYYIDLFKGDETEIRHSKAVASYSVFAGFKSAIVINLQDFADEKGMVKSIIFYNYDTTTMGVNADSEAINIGICESKVLTTTVESMSKVDNEGGVYFWAMPNKKVEGDSVKTFVGWEYNDRLYGAFNEWPKGTTAETVTATPVYVDFYMAKGASVRLTEPSGIRWQTYIGAQALTYLNGQKDNTLVFGTTVKCAGSSKELNIKTENGWNVDFGANDEILSYHFNAVMTNMEGNYERLFIATGYVDITYHTGRTMRIWAAQCDNERSIQYIAEKAKADIGNNGFNPTEAEIAVLDKYIAGDGKAEA